MILAGALAFTAIAAVLGLFFAKTPVVKRVISTGSANAVPAFYICTLTVFLALFERGILRFRTNQFGREAYWVRFSYVLPYLTFAKLYFSNPGWITRRNWEAAYRQTQFDEVLYLPHRECRTCAFAKPARSRHCSACNRCVAWQDHHCIWINNCVGGNNFRWFVLFLFTNVYIFAYGLSLLIRVLNELVGESWQLSGKWYYFPVTFMRQGPVERYTACLTYLCGLLLPLIAVFLGFHLMYVYAGVTTAEAGKWSDIKELIPEQRLFYIPQSTVLVMKRNDGTFNRNLPADELSKLQLVRHERDLPNIYDEGLVKNFVKLATFYME